VPGKARPGFSIEAESERKSSEHLGKAQQWAITDGYVKFREGWCRVWKVENEVAEVIAWLLSDAASFEGLVERYPQQPSNAAAIGGRRETSRCAGA
jgi:hypothetical protein